MSEDKDTAEIARAKAKAYRDANRERINAAKKVNYQKHREKIRAKQKENYGKNQEKVKAQSKEYHYANREAILAKMRGRYLANREERLAKDKQRRAENRPVINSRMKARRDAAILTFREMEKAWRLKRKYGMTLEQYEAMFNAQRGRCKCCKTVFGLLRRHRPCVDHCHRTNQVRGIICDRCNLLLGLANDSSKTLRLCARYLAESVKAVIS